jgi:uncharacterized protein
MQARKIACMPASIITLDTLRHYAIARSLFTPTTLSAAIAKLGFVQADPIRAPAIWSGAMPSWV